jgi:hypothetical protein
MQITQEELRQIIKEELNAVLDEKRKKKKKKKKKKKGKKDACYHKVRSRYDVWPSAYASGALVKCRKVGAKNWGNSKNEALEKGGHSDELHGSMEEMHQQLADKHGVSLKDIDKELKKGTAEEAKEHGEQKAHEIAMEHVFEDPKYYTKMEKANIDEVYSDKQRRFMCAKAEQGADRPKGLSKKEAEEMCKGPKLDEKKKRNGLSSISEASTVTIRKGSHKERIVLDEKKKKRKKAGTESSKEGNLRDWFKRKGAKGKKGGWVDCNAPDGKGGYKSCGRSDGEKRKKYPACRPTPGACKERGKGSSWGKKAKKGKKK